MPANSEQFIELPSDIFLASRAEQRSRTRAPPIDHDFQIEDEEPVRSPAHARPMPKQGRSIFASLSLLLTHQTWTPLFKFIHANSRPRSRLKVSEMCVGNQWNGAHFLVEESFFTDALGAEHDGYGQTPRHLFQKVARGILFLFVLKRRVRKNQSVRFVRIEHVSNGTHRICSDERSSHLERRSIRFVCKRLLSLYIVSISSQMVQSTMLWSKRSINRSRYKQV
jgi:hypothetical protein